MVEFVILNNVECPYFLDMIKIYRESFPENERHPDHIIASRIASGREVCYVGIQNCCVVFIALLWPLHGTEFILLDYMATKNDSRRSGIATSFLHTMMREMERESKYLLLEVEDPECGDNLDERICRVKFYKSIGIKQLLGVNYILPPLQGGKETQMVLMVVPSPPSGFIAGCRVRDLVERIYLELYGIPRGSQLLEDIRMTINDRIECT